VSIPESHLAQEAIAALVDGELPAGPAERAARHLFGCLQCRLAVAAQREAKEALHASADVTVPGDLMDRLRAIPFTTEVPGGAGPGAIAVGADDLTLTGARGSFSFPLTPAGRSQPRPGQARWLRRGMIGTVAVLGAGVTALALTLPADGAAAHPGPAAGASGTEEHTTIVPPVVRTVTVGDSGSLPGFAVGGAAGGTP
jgi:Putative zinc-finger